MLPGLKVKKTGRRGQMKGAAVRAARGGIHQLKAHRVKARLVGGEPAAVNMTEGIQFGKVDAFADIELVAAIGGTDRNRKAFDRVRGIFVLLPETEFAAARTRDGNYLGHNKSSGRRSSGRWPAGPKSAGQRSKGDIRLVQVRIQRRQIAVHKKTGRRDSQIRVGVVSRTVGKAQLGPFLLTFRTRYDVNMLGQGREAAPG